MRITMLAGSNRRNASSTNVLLYMKRILEEQGHEVTLVDLAVTQLPLYSPDARAHQALEPGVGLLRQAIGEAQALVLATPEYHGSISGVLKNALDYIGSDVVGGKVVLSVSSAGGAVGVSSLTQLQAIVRNLHGINSPEWVSVGGVKREFDADGQPRDPQIRERIERALHRFIALASALT